MLNLITKKEKIIIYTAAASVFLILFFDNSILKFTESIRIYPLDGLMLFMTDFGLLFCITMFGIYLLIKKRYTDLALVLLTSVIALEVSYLLKVFFQTPRPFAALQVAVIPLTQASGYSMPSLHTAFCFSIWPYLERNFTKKTHIDFGYTAIIIIALSRLYLGVHYLSDIVVGGLIGYLIAEIWIYLEENYHVLEWFVFNVKDKFELRRQVTHLLIGCSIIFLLKLQLINAQILFLILMIGGALSLYIRNFRPSSLNKLLLYFERPGDFAYFPGKGSFFLVLGALFAVILFERNIALAAISIVAVGDAITTIIGTYFGKIKNPLNPEKHLEGTFLAIILSTLAAFFFVDFKTAFIGGLVGMIFESITGRYIHEIVNDNVMIPIVSGIAMAMVM